MTTRDRPVWDANLPAELRDGIVQCLRAARRWELRAEAPNGARIRLVNIGDTERLAALVGQLTTTVDGGHEGE